MDVRDNRAETLPSTVSRGERYQATVPDTLDLAEVARLGVNSLTLRQDPARGHMPFHYPSSEHSYGGMEFLTGNECWGKHVEALLKMRLVSGSTQNLESDRLTIASMVDCIDDQGLYWAKVSGLWDGKPLEGDTFAGLGGQGRVMTALVTLARMDPNPRWRDLLARMARGLSQVAFHKDDYAYYPPEAIGALAMPRSGWSSDEEPQGLSHARDGASWGQTAAHTLFAYGIIIRGLCQWFELSQDQEALVFAGKLVNFLRKDRNWQPEAAPGVVTPPDQGQFEGHFHASLWGLWGLLDYGILTGDEQLKELARRGYEYARTLGNISRIGMFSEGCTVGDMTNLAIRLSEAGVGDYWNDIDLYVRNQLTEIQVGDQERLRATGYSAAHLGSVLDHPLNPTAWKASGCFCCDWNVKLAYYHAWGSIVRAQGDHVRINLLLNRASPWLDVDSYLPYEGKVVIRNKSARRISVRLPDWVDGEAVRVAISGSPGDATPVEAPRLAHWLLLSDVVPEQTITVTFPIKEWTEQYRDGWEGNSGSEITVIPTRPVDQRTVYTLRFRANAVVDIQPRQNEGVPVYDRRDHLRGDKAPMKTVERHVAEQQV